MAIRTLAVVNFMLKGVHNDLIRISQGTFRAFENRDHAPGDRV
jgi:hypothetical protein